jgi:hypothetical protein
MSHQALAARVGICGDRDDQSLRMDMEKEAAFSVVVGIVRERMTPQLIAAINNVQSHPVLLHEVNKALGNIEKWFAPK